ncbi:MAG: 3-dehydroquinate synthase [Candidatus Hydromicrobium sp.]|nr:3-dehydroquinate synthase [Actinomycetota bacterium]
MEEIRINLGERSYSILVGCNCLRDLGKHIKQLNLGYTSVFVITSPKIGKLYTSDTVRSLKNAGYKDIGVEELPDGEKNKSLANIKKFYDKINKFDNEDKKILVLNLGGGVVGDFGGYLAGTWRRGVDYIQVPTTLLAMVDCGIGGKTGVNFKKQKNLIGVFYQPKLVFADINLLRTLNKRELRSGLAEVIKYGVISTPTLFKCVEDNYDKILNLDNEFDEKLMDYISIISYKIKKEIVEKDEEDRKGIRALLNYGHTIGHAVEAASNYAYRHGEAISIGMVVINDIAVKMGIMNQKDAQRIEDLLCKVGLPTRIKQVKLNDIMGMLKHDKKAINGVNRFIFATKIGNTIPPREGVDKKLVLKAIKNRLNNI